MELPLHPKLVHLPIALAVLVPLLATILTVAIARGWLRLRTWTLTVGSLGLLVLSSFVAMRSGEDDEERVERIVPEAAIERHEEAAERFTWAAALVLLLSTAPLVLHRRPRAALTLAAGTTLASFGLLVLGYGVGQSGGDLVWRHGAANAFIAAGPDGGCSGAVPPGRGGDDDDR